MTLGERTQKMQALEGRRVRLTIDEPDVFARTGDDVRDGTIRRLLVLENDVGAPYEVAIVHMEKPVAYGVHSSDVVSLMTRYAKDRLTRLLSREKIAVNVVLEDPSLLEADVSDPRMTDKTLGFYLGYGMAVLETI